MTEIIVSASVSEPSTTVEFSFSPYKTLATTIEEVSKKLLNRVNDKFDLHWSNRVDMKYDGSYPSIDQFPRTTTLAALHTPSLKLLFTRTPEATAPSIHNQYESKLGAIRDLNDMVADNAPVNMVPITHVTAMLAELREQITALGSKLDDERAARVKDVDALESKLDDERAARVREVSEERAARVKDVDALESKHNYECTARAKETRDLRSLIGVQHEEIVTLNRIVLPLHIRAFLNLSRARILHVMEAENAKWEVFCAGREESGVIADIAKQTGLSSRALAHLFGGSLRRLGNDAAHDCTREQAREAIATKTEQEVRVDLEQLFKFCI